MRESILSGKYFSKTSKLLLEEINACYENERGPGALPINDNKEELLGIIAPNSPYNHSGPCAAWAYKEIAENKKPDIYIIISSNHNTIKSGITNETFVTPLGFVRVDQEFTRELIKKGNISLDDEIHKNDFGIEVQLPLLQHAKYKEKESIKIVPIIVSNDINLKELALDIKETLFEQNKKAIFIVSSNLLRHGPLFHYLAFIKDPDKEIFEFDKKIINYIKEQKPEELFDFVDKSLAPIDGLLAIKLLLYLLPKSKVSLEQYYRSTDILNEKKNSVSYASFTFKKD